jgi:hypothetical protein
MHLTQKIAHLKEKKANLIKKYRKSRSALKNVKTRAKILATNLQIKHFQNFSTPGLKTKIQLKVFTGAEGLKKVKVPVKLKNKYAKKIANHNKDNTNIGLPGVKLADVPNTFTTTEPSLREFRKLFKHLRRLKPKAIVYSYAVDKNSEIWFGHVYILTKKNRLKSVKHLENVLNTRKSKRVAKKAQKATQAVDATLLVDANTLTVSPSSN